MTLFGEYFSWLEITGTVFGIAGVWLTVKRNIYCFPTGLVNVILYAWLFYQSKLYADALLQLFYVVLLLYGWYEWMYGKKVHTEGVSVTSFRLRVVLILSAGLFTFIAGSWFSKNTDAAFPFIDALTTAMSLVAQWMVARKKIENWLVWIAADLIYIGMYISKHLYLTSILYFIFIILAIAGFMEWKKELRRHAIATN